MTEPNCLATFRIDQVNTIFSVICDYWLTIFNLRDIFIFSSPVWCSFYSHSFLGMVWFALLIKWRITEKSLVTVLWAISSGALPSGFCCRQASAGCISSFRKIIGKKWASWGKRFQFPLSTSLLNMWLALFLPIYQGEVYTNCS